MTETDQPTEPLDPAELPDADQPAPEPTYPTDPEPTPQYPDEPAPRPLAPEQEDG